MVEEIKYSKVASIRKLDGLIWSAVVIESAGGAVKDLTIRGLNKQKSAQAVAMYREKAA